MNRSPSEQQARLSRVLDEVRSEPAPRVDWPRVERRLWAAIDAAPTPRAEPRLGWLRFWPAPAALALAAAAGFLLVHAREGQRPEAAPAPFAAQAGIDGDSLAADELLQAGTAPLRVLHRGRAEWTLEPNAKASVLEHGGVVRVRLVSGALSAHVVKANVPERFVVEAANTRVAVRGTVFRVALAEDRSTVDVSDGVVAVGPRERANPSATLLRAPAHAEFTLEGARISDVTESPRREKLERPAAAHRARRPLPEAPSEARAALPAASNDSAHTLTIGEVESGVSQVVAAVSTCFRENTPGSGNLRVSAKSAITLHIQANGSVEQVSFSPPLAPSVQECSERAVLQVVFAPADEGTQITRVLELTR